MIVRAGQAHYSSVFRYSGGRNDGQENRIVSPHTPLSSTYPTRLIEFAFVGRQAKMTKLSRTFFFVGVALALTLYIESPLRSTAARVNQIE